MSSTKRILTKQAKNVNASFSDFAEHCIIFFFLSYKEKCTYLTKKSFFQKTMKLSTFLHQINNWGQSFPVVSPLGTIATSAPYGLKSNAQSSCTHDRHGYYRAEHLWQKDRSHKVFFGLWLPKDCQLSSSFDGLLYHIWL